MSVSPGSAESRREGAGHRTKSGRITRRSIVIGLVLAIVHTCWVAYEEGALQNLPPGFAFTTFVLIPSVLGLVFILLCVNSVLRRVAPDRVLSSAELMVIFVMCTVASAIAGADTMHLLFPTLMALYVPGASTRDYDKLIPHVPSWFVPQDQAVQSAYHLGMHRFWAFFSPEVFRAWAVPMLFWGAFIFIMAWTMFCLVSILRRQWLDKEKLSFPIIELPMMMVRQGGIGSLFANKLMLAGFAMTAVLLSINYAACLWPSIPGINLHINNIARTSFPNPPLSGMNPIWISWWPFAIGLCYLMPLDVSFSSWFFYVLIRLSMAFATAQGWRDPGAGFSSTQFPFFQDTAKGAWIGLFMVVMWSARTHLSQVARNAFGGERIPGDEKEPLSYRTAFYGAIGGFTALVAMMAFSGLKLYLALLFFAIYFLAVTVMTRIYSQIAVPIFELYFFSSISLTSDLSGTNAMSYRDATILAHFHWMDRCYRPHPMGHEMEAVVFADKQGQSMRTMSRIVMMAVVIGIVVGMLTILQIAYDRGGSAGGIVAARIESFNRSVSWLNDPKPVQPMTLGRMGISMAIVFLLAFARSTWFGFPLHPIGYAFACGYSMEYIWNIVLLTWFIKVLVLRYGGLRLYRRSIPLFLGFILGDAVTQFLWSIGLSIFHAQGCSPYLQPSW